MIQKKMDNYKILNRAFIIIFLSQLSLSFTNHFLTPTFPIYLSRLGLDERGIGILVGALSVSSLIFRPFVGKMLLKIAERNVMFGGALLVSLSCVGYLFASPFWPLFVIRILHGMGYASCHMASVTLVANIGPERHRGQILGYYYLAFNFAFALAPAIGMFLINAFSFNLLFSCCTALSLCSVYLSTRFESLKVNATDGVTTNDDNSYLNFKALPPAIMYFFIHIIWGALAAFFPLFAIDHGIRNPGFFFGVYATVLILGRGLGGRLLDSGRREKIMLPCLTTYILSMIILAFSKTFPMFILVAVIWGTGNAFLSPMLAAYTVERAGPSRGTALATFTALADLGVGLGSVVMGLILHWTGSYPFMFLCLALTGTLNLAYFYIFVRERQK